MVAFNVAVVRLPAKFTFPSVTDTYAGEISGVLLLVGNAIRDVTIYGDVIPTAKNIDNSGLQHTAR